MTERKRLVVSCIVVLALVPMTFLANWLLSPLTLPSANVERHLVREVLRWSTREPGSHSGKPMYLGTISGDGLRDFADEDMAFWTDQGYEVRPVSALEPSGLGQVRDKISEESGHALLLKDHVWVGRNTVMVNVVLRSGFCANGATVTLTHRLWGWSFDGVRPFYDFDF
jgi:hypothetical protein